MSGFSRLALYGGAGALILVAYLFSLGSLLFLGLLVALEFVLLIALARVGLSGFVARILAAHLRLITIFVRSLWLSKGIELRVVLQLEEAPRLFEMLRRLCERTEVAEPREVLMEMTVNAWVRLQGYRRGAGRTVLGLGYDLLAGLTQAELEGVIAHELSHAKLVRRGIKRWLAGGLNRSGQLARGLWAETESARRANRSSELAGLLMRTADRLTRTSARLVAACSRQDEFDADLGAAAISGPGVLRSSLLKLDRLDRCAGRLPWNERVARLQSGRGFSQWLIDEFSKGANEPGPERSGSLFYRYSTHPSLEDRLNALPPSSPEEGFEASGPALQLLSDPDAVADKLVAEIQRVTALQERKDSRRLQRWTRKSRSQTHLRPLQLLAIAIIILAVLVGVMGLATEGMSLGLVVTVLILAALGMGCYRLGRYRERLTLSIPAYSAIKAKWEEETEVSEETVKKLEADLQAAAARKGKRRRILHLAADSYAALAKCDYLTAHVAARLCLQLNNKSVEGAVGLAVASAAWNQIAPMEQALAFVHQRTGLRGGSAAWAAGWACVLQGDWTRGEAALESVRQEHPDHPTILSLLALCQSRRGKLQSALQSARQACASPLADIENVKLLIELLLRAGYLREARERLTSIQGAVRNDPELLLSMIRLHALSDDFVAAEECIQLLRGHTVSNHLLVRVGEVYELARQPETAAAFYKEALATGHYPQALLGLGRLAGERGDTDQAGRYILAALDLDRPLGRRAIGPLPLFHQIIGQLLSLEKPVPNCRAWIARLDGGGFPAAVAKTSFMIYAQERKEAEQSLATIINALQPGLPPVLTPISWREAPKEQQPDGPVRPGVQGVVS